MIHVNWIENMFINVFNLKDIRSSRQCLRPKMISSMAIDLPIGFEDCLVDNVIEAVEAQVTNTYV